MRSQAQKGDLVYVLVYIHQNTVLSYVGKYHVQVHRMVPKLTGLINDILYVDGKQVGESHVTTTTMASQPLILASH